MHRSGTSAATRLIGFLGLHLPTGTDLVPPSAKNPAGYWESMSLVAMNARILAAVGSDMSCPLALPADWHGDPRLEHLRPEALATFRRAFPDSPWVWKDPRTCLTLRFWHDLLEAPAAVVLVNRNPLEIVASSLRSRADEGKIYTLALWERYLREAIAQLAGRQVLVTDYADLIAGPRGWFARAHDFLASAGLPVTRAHEEEALAFLDTGLRHSTFTQRDLVDDPDVSVAQRELYLALQASSGSQASFVVPPLPRETPTTEALLAERRKRLELRRDLALRPAGAISRPWHRARRRLSRRAAPEGANPEEDERRRHRQDEVRIGEETQGVEDDHEHRARRDGDERPRSPGPPQRETDQPQDDPDDRARKPA